jgi:allantoicase
VLALGCRGTIHRFVVDTTHFKGNYPDRCSIEIADLQQDADALRADARWVVAVPESQLQADHVHEFTPQRSATVATHIRLNIIPDGGVARLRVLGVPDLPQSSASGTDRKRK